MPHQIGGTAKSVTPTYKTKGEKLEKALVVEEVKIIEVPRVYHVPKVIIKEEVQTKYNTRDEKQVRYNTVEENTIKYIPKEESTTKYVIKEEPTVKYVAKEVEVERPVLMDKPYERPVVKEKEYTIATIADMENVRKLMEALPKLVLELAEVKKKLDGIRDYKLVEKTVEVPRLQWVTTPVERIIWKDVERERPK